MADFNTKYILPGDDKDTIINKINHNFYQVFFNGVGERGPDGYVGATVLEVKLGEMVKQVQLAKELLIGFSPLPNQVILNLKMVMFGLT